MTSDHPPIVVVGGLAGSGKTTLARRLAPALCLPLIGRDDLKEAMMDALGSPDRARSRQIGGASYHVMYRVVDRLLDAGVGAIVESNFQRGRSEPELSIRTARARAVLIHCQIDPILAVERTIARAERGERHHGHHDRIAATDALAELAANPGATEPLDLPIPILRVETTHGYAPSFHAIVAWVRTSLAAPDRTGDRTASDPAPIDGRHPDPAVHAAPNGPPQKSQANDVWDSS